MLPLCACWAKVPAEPWGGAAGRACRERVWARLVSLSTPQRRGALPAGLFDCLLLSTVGISPSRTDGSPQDRAGGDGDTRSPRRGVRGEGPIGWRRAGWRGGRWRFPIQPSVSVSVARGRSPVMAVVDCLSWVLLGLGVTCLGHGLVTCGKAGATGPGLQDGRSDLHRRLRKQAIFLVLFFFCMGTQGGSVSLVGFGRSRSSEGRITVDGEWGSVRGGGVSEPRR